MQGRKKHRNMIGMHMQNRACANTGFLSTMVFGSHELEEHRNGEKHGQIIVKPHENVKLESYYMPLIVSLISIIIRIENDKSTLLSIKQTLDYKAKLSMHRLELVQRDIYEHRKKCFFIPDRIYRFLKDKQEKKQKDMTLFR